jgi:hypothetical protein
MELVQAFEMEWIDVDDVRLHPVGTLKTLCRVQYVVQHEDCPFACGFDCYDGDCLLYLYEACMIVLLRGKQLGREGAVESGFKPFVPFSPFAQFSLDSNSCWKQ